MKHFTYEPRFDPITGKETTPQRVDAGVFCDFCGHLFDEGEYPDPTYRVVESGNMEASFHAIWFEVDEFEVDEFEVDLYALFETHDEFIYCQPWCGEKECSRAMVETLKTRHGTLADAMHQCRFSVIQKLVDFHGYSVEALGLVEKE